MGLLNLFIILSFYSDLGPQFFFIPEEVAMENLKLRNGVVMKVGRNVWKRASDTFKTLELIFIFPNNPRPKIVGG